MALQFQEFNVTIRLEDHLLGTIPKSRAVYANYIAGKAQEIQDRERARAEKKGEPARLADGSNSTPEAFTACVEEEVESVQDLEERGWTGFFTDRQGNPILFNYAIKGFFCEAARALRQHGGDEDEGGGEAVKQLQDKVKRYVFVRPRQILLPKVDHVHDFEGEPLLVVTPTGLVCERPLRAMTAQGPRVTVVRSDVIAAGGLIEFKLRVLRGGGITKNILRDLLTYGEEMGLGQWRSSGLGTFSVQKLEAA